MYFTIIHLLHNSCNDNSYCWVKYKDMEFTEDSQEAEL